MLKNNFPKKIMVSSLILIFFILLIMVGKYIFDKATYIPPTTSQQVTKTSESNGYLSSSSQVSKNQSSTEKAQAIVPVKNTGVSEWLQVKSQGSGEKFTDLSTGNFKIYKVHSPQVLKTATSTDSPVLSMTEVVSKYPDSLIMNASGFNMTTGKSRVFKLTMESCSKIGTLTKEPNMLLYLIRMVHQRFMIQLHQQVKY